MLLVYEEGQIAEQTIVQGSSVIDVVWSTVFDKGKSISQSSFVFVAQYW